MTFKKIGFVTDSVADIPPELVARLGIRTVPIFVNYGGRSYLDDGKELVREEYYDLLPALNPLPTTAAPSPGMAKEVVHRAFAEYDHLFIITIPQQLSATYNVLRLAANNLPQERITLVDAGSVSLGLGWQVVAGAEIAAETGDVAAVQRAITSARTNYKLAAMLSSLEYLRRSGRISLASAGLGTLLQIKPIVTVTDGIVVPLARVRTASRAKAELIEMARACGPIEKLAILHTNNLEEAAWLRDQLADIRPDETYIVNANPALGTHIGPQALGFSALLKSWRQ
ncbi:MAG: DegV family protein [Anaerolineae bacterium]|nr:DegV family protein [Anaerolineae bacterium]